jgi:hypothetical protein
MHPDVRIKWAGQVRHALSFLKWRCFRLLLLFCLFAHTLSHVRFNSIITQ